MFNLLSFHWNGTKLIRICLRSPAPASPGLLLTTSVHFKWSQVCARVHLFFCASDSLLCIRVCVCALNKLALPPWCRVARIHISSALEGWDIFSCLAPQPVCAGSKTGYICSSVRKVHGRLLCGLHRVSEHPPWLNVKDKIHGFQNVLWIYIWKVW